ncbi:hypothetical protein ABT288_38040 [Streptomyces sp. NPDC001093]|uniref:hypothetical protein n=1 Tax=Streptomyces sp. NPDC001093 TaxID=3154376 RepID=UPI00331CAB40
MRLLDLGFFRSGSDRHMRSSETYGLTTMLREHVRCGQGEITFSCAAKGGVETVRALEQVRAVTRALLRRLPGGDRFLASCVGGFWRDPHSDDLNEASRRLAGAEVTAKDFRTWGGRAPEWSRRRFSIFWTAPVDDSSGRDAFYALLHDRTRSSLHLPSTGPGARSVPRQARRAAF